MTDDIHTRLQAACLGSVISLDDRLQFEKSLNLSTRELMRALVGVAERRSLPMVSKFQVGAVGLGKSGRLYLGANIEFAGMPIGNCIHGEQCVVAHLVQFQDSLIALAVNASPCGHCRQFLNEQLGAHDLEIFFPQVSTTLSQLLPFSFGPESLGVSSRMACGPVVCDDAQREAWGLEITQMDPSVPKEVAEAASRGVQTSHTPYSHSPSGAAIVTAKAVFIGAYLECAAYNPSLPPLQTAIAQLIASGGALADITTVVLAEPRNAAFSSLSSGEALARKCLPGARVVACSLSPWKQ